MTKASLQRLITVLLSMHFILIAAQNITVIDAEGTTKLIKASEAGTMTYSQTDGTLTIAGQAYQVDSIAVDEENDDIALSPVASTTDAAKRLYRYFRNNYGKSIRA